MLRIGLTGGIGGGKTEVGRLLEKKDAKVLVADEIARAIHRDNRVVIDKIKSVFGEEVYHHGELNRKQLGRIVFSDREKITQLNNIMYPEIKKEFSRLEDLALKEGCQVLIKEAAILFEVGDLQSLDYILAVVASLEIRTSRLRARGGLDDTAIKSRMLNQMTNNEFISRADYVITNNGTLDELENKVNVFWKEVT